METQKNTCQQAKPKRSETHFTVALSKELLPYLQNVSQKYDESMTETVRQYVFVGLLNEFGVTALSQVNL